MTVHGNFHTASRGAKLTSPLIAGDVSRGFDHDDERLQDEDRVHDVLEGAAADEVLERVVARRGEHVCGRHNNLHSSEGLEMPLNRTGGVGKGV